MTTKVIQKWEVTVSITRTLEYPIEDMENKEQFIEWAESLNGKRHIQNDFIKRLNCYGCPRTADIFIDDVELKSFEVRSTDTDPRV